MSVSLIKGSMGVRQLYVNVSFINVFRPLTAVISSYLDVHNTCNGNDDVSESCAAR